MAENEQSPNIEGTEKAGAEKAGTEGTPKNGSDISGGIIGGVIWLAIISGILFGIFRSDKADVLLHVSAKDHLIINGAVMFDGAPVTNGKIHLVLDDAKSKRYLGSVVLPVTSSGSFGTSEQNPLDEVNSDRPLRATAKFLGQYTEKDGKILKPLSGEETIYINFSPPLGKRTLWGILGIVILLMIVLIALFTGELTRRKARALFSVTYFMTFLSLAVPIAITLLISQNLYLVEMMEEAPLGLVKGTAKGVTSPQWLVNIGGAVRKSVPVESQPIKSTETKDKAQPEERALPPQTVELGKTPSLPGDSGASRKLPLGSDEVSVEGGLAVPFYVVMLAMLGAGINMTRSVPKIQQGYDVSGLAQAPRALWKSTLTFFSWAEDPVATRPQREAASEIRKSLIENYMYLLSAPFLAITVYYILQIVAESVAGPVLVVMAFATGLISDAIISWIIEFARKTLKSDEEKKPPAGAAQPAQGERTEESAK